MALRLPAALTDRPRDTLERLERRILRDAATGPVLSRDARRVVSEPAASDEIDPRSFGDMLFRALFADPIREALLRPLAAVREDKERGLRIRLRFDPKQSGPLDMFPWELLHCAETNEFLSKSIQTPIIRHLDVRRMTLQPKPLRTLRILVAIADPSGVSPLDVAREKALLQEVLAKRDDIQLRFLEHPTLRGLRRLVRDEPFDVFHFIGHGSLDGRGHGVLLFEDREGQVARVRGETLAEHLVGGEPIRLVFLNACKSASLPRAHAGHDPYQGVASALLLSGIPAAIAMQFPIGDQAAIELSHAFYDALARGDALETAVVEARIALNSVYTDSWEWATPVLYLGVPHGDIFKRPEDRAPSGDGEAAQPADRREPERQESSDRSAPVSDQPPLAAAIELLDYERYEEAIEGLGELSRGANQSADALFYLALARLGGKRPRSSRPGIIKRMESDLLMATTMLGQQGQSSAHVALLLALLKHDFYQMQGLRVRPPTVEDLLAEAAAVAIARDSSEAEALAKILHHAPTPDNPVRAVIESRILSARTQ